MKKIIVTIITIMMMVSLVSCGDTEPVAEPVNEKATSNSSRSLSKEEEIELFDKFEAGLISKEYLEEVLTYSRSNDW